MKIGNMYGKKWKVIYTCNGPSYLKLDDEGDEFVMEKHETEAAWRFYLKERYQEQVKRNYISYYEAATIHPNLAMETIHVDDVLEDRFHFQLLLQPSGRLLFQPLSSPGKFVGFANDNLLVLDKGLKKKFEWVVGHDVKPWDEIVAATVVVQASGTNQGMASSNAESLDQIPTTGSSYNWNYNGSASSCTFQVPNSTLGVGLDGSMVVYDSSLSSCSLVSTDGKTAIQIGSQYLCFSGSYVGITSGLSSAAKWSPFVTLFFPFLECQQQKTE